MGRRPATVARRTRGRAISGEPGGVFTFLFTDIEQSTERWERVPAAMRAALARHDELLGRLIAENGGHVFKTAGDAFFAAFDSGLAAVSAACAIQRAVAAEDWGAVGPLRVRVALHTGPAERRVGASGEADYVGLTVNRTAGIASAAHGGQTLLSDTTAGLVGGDLPDGVALRDLGRHHLRDLIQPEHVHQLVTTDLPVEFPALRTQAAARHNLPTQPSPLIGREALLASLRRHLREGETRLLTLTGPGGSGKTRLALQLGADLIDEYPDGVWFVPLDGLPDPALVLPAAARTLGVRDAGPAALLDAVQAHLHNRRLLLILDNFEHVPEAAGIVADLLGAAGRCRVVATSRVPLRLRGERLVEVPPLDVPAAADAGSVVPASLAENPAVALFVARARAVMPSFALTPETAPPVAELCRRLDGLPLAIELVAARVRSYPPAVLLARLGRLHLPVGGAGPAFADLPARQQTLHATIGWSFRLLPTAEQRLLARLSVFAGGCTIPAATAVCDDGTLDVDPLEGVSTLLDHNLLRGVGAGLAAEPRFRLLETVREFAGAQLDAAGGVDRFRRRHAEYLADLSERSEAELRGAEQVGWLDELEAEHDNFRAALAWSLAPTAAPTEDRLGVGARLGGALASFWSRRGYFTEGRRWLDSLLAASESAESALAPAVEARLCWGAGIMAHNQSEFRRATELHERSLALRRQTGDRAGAANALVGLGLAAQRLGAYDRAIDLFGEALAIRRAVGDRWGTAAALNNLGIAAYRLGRDDEARALHEESLALKRQLRDTAGIAASLVNLGNLALRRHDFARARAMYEEGLALQREQGDRRMVAGSLLNLGYVARSVGDHAAARRHHAESIEGFRALREWSGLVENLGGVARIAAATGHPDTAARLLGAVAGGRAQLGATVSPRDAAEERELRATLTAALNEAAVRSGEETGAGTWPDAALEEALAFCRSNV